MSLWTAHRILISASVFFFLGFGLWELWNYYGGGNIWGFFRGVLYLLVSCGFGWYLGSMKRWIK